MSSDVISGLDGKPRCAWAGAGDTALVRYHDEVWGTRTDDESAMFEALTLGVFQVGLSWSIVFGKRDAFGTAFRGFNVARVAAMTEQDIDRLMEDASIIRNRAKIQATVGNARAMMSASPDLAAQAKSYKITRTRAPRSIADLPKTTPRAETFAKQLKNQGFFKTLRRAHERVRVHAERRRGQRPRPWLLPRDRLSHHVTNLRAMIAQRTESSSKKMRYRAGVRWWQ
jgi:DNA-3-methyladenine glycosylase I